MRKGRVGVITFSHAGVKVALRIRQCIPEVELFLHRDAPFIDSDSIRFEQCSELMKKHFSEFACWIFIAPCGIAVRSIAPLIQSKLTDPAVLVIDVGARHVISLMSGHEGGANEYAVYISNILAAEPVITTTSDVEKTWIAGIGCRKGVSKSVIEDLLHEALLEAKIQTKDLRFLASAELKQEERGLLELSAELQIPIRFFPSFLIQSMEGIVPSRTFVQERVGLPGVAEPAALLGGRRTSLCLPRIAKNGVTIALVKENCWWWESDPEAAKTAPTGL